MRGNSSAKLEDIKPTWSYIWASMSSFKKKFVFLLTIVLIDTLLTSVGIGMILPIFQSILSVDVESQWITKIYPGFVDMTPESRIWMLCGFVGTLTVMKAAFNLLNVVYSRYFADTMRANWCDQIGRNIVYGSYSEFIKKKPGVILNDWLVEPLTASRFITTFISYLSSLMMTVLLVMLGFAVDWKVMLVFLAVAGVLVLVLRTFIYGTSVEHSRFKSVYNQELSSSMNESISHVKDIKILTVELERVALTLGVLKKIKSLFIRMTIIQNLPRVMGEMLAILGLVSMLLLTTVVNGLNLQEMLPLAIFFFVTCYKLITAGTATMSAKIKAWQDFNSLRIVNKMCEVDSKDDRVFQTNNLAIERIETDIEFADLSFSYKDNQNLFDQFTLTIPRGKTTFIGGKSGSGKSTVLDLLLRIVSPQSGEVRVNGKNISEYDLRMWRNLFGYVSQDATLFYGTILDNIVLGCNLATLDDVHKACEMSGCMDFINELPECLDTLVGDKGYTLSGGQRKRIAIARAIVRKPSVIIFDEATTSFEVQIERDIINKLRLNHPDLTIIQTSHRTSSEYHTDVTINLDDIILSKALAT